MRNTFFKHSAGVLLLASSLLGSTSSGAAAPTAIEPAAVLTAYANIVHANYADALHAAQSMQRAVDQLIATPSAATLDAARKAWLAAREPYGQTEVFRFYGGPIDDKDDIEGRLNAWPLDEAYVDYVQGKPDSGIINQPSVPLTIDGLIKLNSRGGEANIATGYHAIEFLLWGQDFNADGPGTRSHTDFVDGEGSNAKRRSQYLKLVTDQVVVDLETLTAAWREGADNYRAAFLKQPAQDGLRKIITSMAVLSSAELGGERMQVALDNQDREDEHSCFSDNTHRDIVTNAVGIRNVLTGGYTRLDGSVVKGAGIQELVTQADPALGQKLARAFDASVARAEAIQAPFENEILGGKQAPGRQRVQSAIDALNQQTQVLVQAARTLGITRLSVAPE